MITILVLLVPIIILSIWTRGVAKKKGGIWEKHTELRSEAFRLVVQMAIRVGILPLLTPLCVLFSSSGSDGAAKLFDTVKLILALFPLLMLPPLFTAGRILGERRKQLREEAERIPASDIDPQILSLARQLDKLNKN